MKFIERQFSKHYRAIECALFVMHEPPAFAHTVGCDVHRQQECNCIYQMQLYRATAAAIIEPDGLVFSGVAICSPSDHFVKATGRQKAIGRAFQSYLKRRALVIGHDLLAATRGEKDSSESVIDVLKNVLAYQILEKKKDMGFL